MLSAAVLETIERFSMLRSGDGVVVGLSGGPDSVALTSILIELSSSLDLTLVLAHLNHGLRKEADDDEAFCRELADRFRLPFTSERVDVAREAASSRRSLEDEARRQRYRFLERKREAFGASRIATGHTLDDQAETFLLRLLRGSGGRGLAATYPVVEGTTIRPLLSVHRREILAYLSSRGLPYCTDASNTDPRFVRNRIRHEEIPRLRERYNPRLSETLAGSASILRDEEDWMEEETRARFARIGRVINTWPGRPEQVELDLDGLRQCHPALARRVVRLSLETVRGDLREIARVHISDVLSLIGPEKSGKEIHLPGALVERSFDRLLLRRRSEPLGRIGRKRGYNGFEYRLAIPTRVHIPEGGGVLSARMAPPGSEGGALTTPAAGDAVVLGIGENPPELKVRSPRRGDRFRPLGAKGSKPLTRYLMERKVGREERARVPVVVRSVPDDGASLRGPSREEILWVVGHGVSEASRVSEESRRLRLEWVAG